MSALDKIRARKAALASKQASKQVEKPVSEAKVQNSSKQKKQRLPATPVEKVKVPTLSVDINGLSEMLQVDPGKCRRWLKANDYPTTGGRYRWRPDEADAIAEAYLSNPVRKPGRPKKEGTPLPRLTKASPAKPPVKGRRTVGAGVLQKVRRARLAQSAAA